MKPATTLFSNITASALRKYFSLGMEFSKASETANFIEIVNDWFDIHNSSLKDYSQVGKVMKRFSMIMVLYNIIYFI